MINFQDDRKIKLATFSKNNITANPGRWRNSTKNYFHILPLEDLRENIIAGFKDDFWAYYSRTSIKLHEYFHHLNSSQALCFNLFFPLFYYEKRFLIYVLQNIFRIWEDKSLESIASQLDDKTSVTNSFTSCEFEKILETKEQTNFDFVIQQLNGCKVLFEIKYTENKFSGVVPKKGHIKKFDSIYRPKLEKLLRPEYLNQDFVFKNYQIMRNLSYIDDFTTVVFLFPEGNQDLQGTENLIREILLPSFIQQTRVVNLENLIHQILESEYLKPLQPYFEIFKQKYID
jgi:hypothetical protein